MAPRESVKRGKPNVPNYFRQENKFNQKELAHN